MKLDADKFLPLEEQFVPSILELIHRDSRIFQLRARECLVTLVQNGKLLSHTAGVIHGFKGGNEFAKCNIMEILVEYIQFFDNKLEPYLDIFEDAIRVGCMDPSQEVREVTKRVYDAYRRQYKARAETFKDDLSEESKNNLKAGSSQSSPSQSIPSLSEGSDCDSENVTEPSGTPQRSSTPSAPITPQNRIKPLDLRSSASSSKYMSKDSPVSTASFSSRISKLTVPCDDLPFMKSTRAYHHRLSQSTLATTFGLKSWETSGANVNNFPSSLRVYPIPEDLPDRKPFRV
ncbi:hypothetical protein K493DRAFT_320936 [Basidiobolus meristosporus CBS 931.73]|uniref:CLASP N-terminal domain-containing protein n=1 Tax=Basidiobolus meristosporus CBS 931.73 TaxID=1314790 RepID=A0A1Y1X334_9FUNG|nr:hypothetical protein K493DRAFT_320936 [Basidiobolus meristosporus CBS 931.73]|eukprot:ORX80183.1 hypothetical protein K493DRAFT_320936 [Basidiobolus meristosporus CBS 931.73]